MNAVGEVEVRVPKGDEQLIPQRAVGDDDEPGWHFTVAEADAPAAVSAVVSVVVGGLRWVVSSLDPSRVIRVETDLEPSPWAIDAVGHLLGSDAEAFIREDRDPAGALITLPGDRHDQRAAMGLLAVAASEPDPSILVAFDAAVLLHQAGLDTLVTPLPGHEDLADDALEFLDVLPDAVLDAVIYAAARGDGSSTITQLAASLAACRAFIGAEANALLRGVDVDADFASLITQLDLADLRASLSAAPVPGYRGPTDAAGRTIDVLVTDLDVAGVLSAEGSVRDSNISVVVRFDGITRPPHQLVVRALDPSRTSVLSTAELRQNLDDPDLFEIEFPSPSAEVGSAEIVLDSDLPVLGPSTARARHLDAHARSFCRLIRHVAADEGHRPVRRTDARAARDLLLAKRIEEHRVAAEIRPDLPVNRITARPSELLHPLVAEVAARIISDLRDVEPLGERAAAAHNIRQLLVFPSGPRSLCAELALIEGETRLRVLEAGGGGTADDPAIPRIEDCVRIAQGYAASEGLDALAEQARDLSRALRVIVGERS